MRTSYVVLTGYLAISIPKIGLFMNFIGSIACTSVVFIFPVLIYERAFEGEITLRDKTINKVIIIIGDPLFIEIGQDIFDTFIVIFSKALNNSINIVIR